VVVLEDYEHARNRGATILAEVRGYGTAFDPMAGGEYDLCAWGAQAAIEAALSEAKMAPDDVDLIAANANSSHTGDLMEARAIARVFGEGVACPPVTALKSMLGESYSAAGALQVAGGALALNHGGIPPTINHTEPDPDCPVAAVVTSPQERDLHTVLVNAFGCTGANASLILARASA
jgi:3-oxoacyl-[acyl-carrier-protein] synthase II